MSADGRSCPHCDDGQLSSPPLGEYAALTLRAVKNPLNELAISIKSTFNQIRGVKQTYVSKCRSCGGYAVACPNCDSTLGLAGTPREMETFSCSSCDMDLDVRR